MISEYFILATRNLRKRQVRSWLTMLGIIISVATIFMLISLSLGLQNAVQEQFRLLGTDKFFIQPKTGFLGAPGSVGGTILTEGDVNIIEKTRGVKDFSYFLMGSGKIEVGKKIRYLTVLGTPPDRLTVYTEVGSLKLAEGSFLKSGDKNSVVLGNSHQTGNLWDREIHAGDKITINGKEFKVKGILELIGNPDDDRMIMMDLDSFRELMEIPDRVDFIMVQVNPGEDINDVASRVEKDLRRYRGVSEKTQDFETSTPEDLLASFQNILQIITVFLGGIAAISLLVGGIGIANTMYTSVLERTREIGVMKAIGAKNSDVMWIFLIESGLLGLVGAGIGVLFGYSVSKIIEYIAIHQLNTTLLQVAAPFYLVGGCLLFGFLVGVISGTLPAMQASKTNVVDALRYE